MSVTSLSPTATPGKPHSFTAKTPAATDVAVWNTAILEGINLVTGKFEIIDGRLLLSSPTFDGLTIDGPLIYSHATQAVSAGDTIGVSKPVIRVSGVGGAVTMTSTPTLEAGVDDQQIRVQCTDSTNTVTLQDRTQLAGSDLHLSGSVNITLGEGDSIDLSRNGILGVWIEINRSINN